MFLHSFFAVRPKMRVRCDNQYKTGPDGGNILGRLMLFECMGICILSTVHESEMRGYLVYLLIAKYFSNLFCLNLTTEHQIGRPYRGFCAVVNFLKLF